METPQLQKQIKELQSQVAPYSKKKGISIVGEMSWKKIYIAIPIAVMIILLLLRPKFLYKDKFNTKGNVTKSLSVQKIFVSWLILSFLFVVGLFGYNYAKKE